MSGSDPVHWQYDEWLSGILERPVCKVEPEAAHGSRLSREAQEFLAELDEDGGFAYVKIPAADTRRLYAFQQHFFFVVDTNVTYEKSPGSDRESSAAVRPAEPADVDSVSEIAATSFRFTRFHLDPQIADEQANAIKGAWVRSYFDGTRGDQMLVAEADGEVRAFALLLGSASDCVTVDLIAVHPDAQRRGLARSLMLSVERLPGIRRVRVGTQLANAPSIALYESLGYRLADAKYVLHYHGG